ncbi:hypothetical protein BA895_10145 [Humibacillus sp. DSM 29435]|nr:hypothetical protein BA895_10145 [Humibacillus sp. DSM 29435]
MCLIAYKGDSKFEDFALNFAGFNALLVALIPSNFEQAIAGEPTSKLPNGLTPDQYLTITRSELAALLVLSAVFVVLDRFIFSPEGFDWKSQPRLAKFLIGVSVVTEAVLVVEIVAFVVAGSTVWLGVGWIHNLAAIFLILNLSFAIASHGWPLRLTDPRGPVTVDQPSRGRGFYRAFASVMWICLAVGFAMIVRDFHRHELNGHWVIAEEVAGIVFFVVFWALASVDVWRLLRRRDLLR